MSTTEKDNHILPESEQQVPVNENKNDEHESEDSKSKTESDDSDKGEVTEEESAVEDKNDPVQERKDESMSESEDESVVLAKVFKKNDEKMRLVALEATKDVKMWPLPTFDPFPKSKLLAADMIIKYCGLYPRAMIGTEFTQMCLDKDTMCEQHLLRHLSILYSRLKKYVFAFVNKHNNSVSG